MTFAISYGAVQEQWKELNKKSIISSLYHWYDCDMFQKVQFARITAFWLLKVPENKIFIILNFQKPMVNYTYQQSVTFILYL
jgi:hypothetical protein